MCAGPSLLTARVAYCHYVDIKSVVIDGGQPAGSRTMRDVTYAVRYHPPHPSRYMIITFYVGTRLPPADLSFLLLARPGTSLRSGSCRLLHDARDCLTVYGFTRMYDAHAHVHAHVHVAGYAVFVVEIGGSWNLEGAPPPACTPSCSLLRTALYTVDRIRYRTLPRGAHTERATFCVVRGIC